MKYKIFWSIFGFGLLSLFSFTSLQLTYAGSSPVGNEQPDRCSGESTAPDYMIVTCNNSGTFTGSANKSTGDITTSISITATHPTTSLSKTFSLPNKFKITNIIYDIGSYASANTHATDAGYDNRYLRYTVYYLAVCTDTNGNPHIQDTSWTEGNTTYTCNSNWSTTKTCAAPSIDGYEFGLDTVVDTYRTGDYFRDIGNAIYRPLLGKTISVTKSMDDQLGGPRNVILKARIKCQDNGTLEVLSQTLNDELVTTSTLPSPFNPIKFTNFTCDSLTLELNNSCTTECRDLVGGDGSGTNGCYPLYNDAHPSLSENTPEYTCEYFGGEYGSFGSGTTEQHWCIGDNPNTDPVDLTPFRWIGTRVGGIYEKIDTFAEVPVSDLGEILFFRCEQQSTSQRLDTRYRPGCDYLLENKCSTGYSTNNLDTVGEECGSLEWNLTDLKWETEQSCGFNIDLAGNITSASFVEADYKIKNGKYFTFLDENNIFLGNATRFYSSDTGSSLSCTGDRVLRCENQIIKIENLRGNLVDAIPYSKQTYSGSIYLATDLTGGFSTWDKSCTDIAHTLKCEINTTTGSPDLYKDNEGNPTLEYIVTICNDEKNCTLSGVDGEDKIFFKVKANGKIDFEKISLSEAGERSCILGTATKKATVAEEKTFTCQNGEWVDRTGATIKTLVTDAASLLYGPSESDIYTFQSSTYYRDWCEVETAKGCDIDGDLQFDILHSDDGNITKEFYDIQAFSGSWEDSTTKITLSCFNGDVKNSNNNTLSFIKNTTTNTIGYNDYYTTVGNTKFYINPHHDKPQDCTLGTITKTHKQTGDLFPSNRVNPPSSCSSSSYTCYDGEFATLSGGGTFGDNPADYITGLRYSGTITPVGSTYSDECFENCITDDSSNQVIVNHDTFRAFFDVSHASSASIGEACDIAEAASKSTYYCNNGDFRLTTMTGTTTRSRTKAFSKRLIFTPLIYSYTLRVGLIIVI